VVSRWRLVSRHGSTLDVAGNQANERAFERPGSSPRLTPSIAPGTTSQVN